MLLHQYFLISSILKSNKLKIRSKMTLRKDVKKTLKRVSTTELIALHFVTFSFFFKNCLFFFTFPSLPSTKQGNEGQLYFSSLITLTPFFKKNVLFFYLILYFQQQMFIPELQSLFFFVFLFYCAYQILVHYHPRTSGLNITLKLNHVKDN